MNRNMIIVLNIFSWGSINLSAIPCPSRFQLNHRNMIIVLNIFSWGSTNLLAIPCPSRFQLKINLDPVARHLLGLI